MTSSDNALPQKQSDIDSDGHTPSDLSNETTDKDIDDAINAHTPKHNGEQAHAIEQKDEAIKSDKLSFFCAKAMY